MPHGWGNESYFARGAGQAYFIKLGAPVTNYEVMSSLGLTPTTVRTGKLGDGTTIVVQLFIEGKNPSWTDFRLHLERIAGIVNTMHHHPKIRQVLHEVPSDRYSAFGMATLTALRQRWDQYKVHVPSVAGEVDECLELLSQQIEELEGTGSVASHNDICNANWLITQDGNIYLIDLDAMSFDDPAHDLGALLWWYYPPGLHSRFLEIAGYKYDDQLRWRMRLRMALHCLHILLPRAHSFDQFDANHFINSLADFRAILDGKENPRGYDDE